MTSVSKPNPAQPATSRQEGTPVADHRTLQTLPATAADPAQDAVDETTQRIPRALIETLDTPPGGTPNSAVDDAAREVAVSVWTTAQTSPAAQRKDRYV